MAIITLTTDFGYSDANVGILKGIIHSINPAAQIIDITHNIKPQDITQGAFMLHISHRHFPPGTIHLSVVDPGLGNSRPICIEVPEVGYFIGPDNKLFSCILDSYPNLKARELKGTTYFHTEKSDTIPGRDIFATVAAHLSLGELFKDVGTLLDREELSRFPVLWPELEEQTNGIRKIVGRVMYIDNFGNIISNIHQLKLSSFTEKQLSTCSVRVEPASGILGGRLETKGLKQTTNKYKAGEIIALYNNNEFLEIARVNGKAAFREAVGGYPPLQYINNGDEFIVEIPPKIGKPF